jgi:hypothetical protein
MQFYPSLSGVQNTRTYHIRILGVNGGVTTQEANGMTITRLSEGLYRITWADNPFQFIGALSQLMASTPGDVDDTEVVFDDYDSTTKTLDFAVTESGTLADLVATERLYIQVIFAETGY